MACKGCHWAVTILEWCGLTKSDKSVKEDSDHEVNPESINADTPKGEIKSDSALKNGPTDMCHLTFAVASISCPDINENTPYIRSPKDELRGLKHPTPKGKSQPESHNLFQRLSSAPQVNIQLKMPPNPTTLSSLMSNAQVGDGNYSALVAQGQGETVSEVGPSDILESELINLERMPEKEAEQNENLYNAGESAIPLEKELKPSLDNQNKGADHLRRYTSPINRPKKRTNATIIVYHVAVADRSRDFTNGFKTEDTDVEMEDLTNHTEDVEMYDLSANYHDRNEMQSGGAVCNCGTQNVEVVANIEHSVGMPGGVIGLKSGDFCSSINVVTSMRYIPRVNSGVSSFSETSLCMGRGSLSTNESKEAIVVIGSPGCNRAILWNEAVKVIYFDVNSKLRKSAFSREGQQDMVAWEIVPLKDAPRGSRSKWVKAVKSGFIRSDSYPLHFNGRLDQSDSNQTLYNCYRDDDGYTSSSSGSTSTSSSRSYLH